MTTRFLAVLLFSLSLALLLAACGGGPAPGEGGLPPGDETPDNGDPDNGEPPELSFQQAGLVMLVEAREQDGYVVIAGRGAFVEAPVGNADESRDPFADNLGSCFIGEARPSPQTPFTSPAGDVIGAGAPLTVAANGEPYTQLVRNELYSYFIAADAAPAPPLVESGLTLEVPGADDGFPAMTKSFPRSEALVMTAPEAGAAIDLETAFTWTPQQAAPQQPSAQQANVVVLTGTGGQADQAFLCVVPDSGTFTLPTETRAELAAAGFSSGTLTSAARYSYTRHVEGDAELTLMVVRFLDLEVVADDDYDDDFGGDPGDDFDDPEDEFGGASTSPEGSS